MLTGKLYCADCGGKMQYRRSTTRAGRDWRGIPNGEVQRTSAGFNCGTYNGNRKQYRQVCCSHSIKEDTVKQLILETIRYALKSVPALLGMYMAQIQPFPLSVPMGAYPMTQGNRVYGQGQAGTLPDSRNTPNMAMQDAEDTQGQDKQERVTEPPDNELIDFDAF